MAKNLMIVESPAKAKTIEKYLGKDFTVKSCFGHIRDLSKGDAAVDVANNFKPKYVVPTDKKNVVKELKELAKSVDQVWLATDEDREGEAISWHLCEVLGLDINVAKRIVFHEITKPAILKAVEKPRLINQDVVNAQQARRVLDRLVGFGLSPLLWRKISRTGSLSAGRVQSVAVRLIVEREREIEDFKSVSSYKVTAFFKVKNEQGRIVTFKGELGKKFDAQNDAKTFLEKCIGAEFKIDNIQVKPAKKTPAPPFTTSTLQQEASRKLGFSVLKTMSVAQKLYEAGKITYMRTDSISLSETARDAAKTAIIDQYGDKYAKERQFKTKSGLAQEAHEAIRPTYFDQNEAGSNNDQKRLYKLIWKRTVASQMADAQLERTTANITISTTPEKIIAKGEVLKFDGYLRLYQVSSLDEDSEEDTSDMLPPLSVGQVLDLKAMGATQRFNRAKPRYNEASLVKQLEERGIGRPSTYAPTISTIQNRGYVEKETREGKERKYQQLVLSGPTEPNPNEITEKTKTEITGAEKMKLFPTDIGKIVNDFLVKYFKEVLDYNFTADIEKQFDEVANGKIVWSDMLNKFYGPFEKTIKYTLENAEREDGQRELGNDPKTNKPIIARLGKYGPMVQIGGATEDENDKPQYAKIRAPYTLEGITLDEALELFKLPRVLGEFENEVVKVNEGRYGPYAMHMKKFYSLEEGQDPLSITFEQALELIKKGREIEAKKIIKTFEEREDVQVLNGRYGPYIKFGKKNVKIPKDKEPSELTLDECLELIEKAPEKKRGGKRKAAPKKTTPKE